MMMKLIAPCVAVFLLSFSQISLADTPVRTDWEVFANNLEKAIQSSNEGVQLSAMCRFIQYADSLKLQDKDTIFEIVRIFRNHKNCNVRLLAMVTLYKSGDKWAMDFLKRHRKFETDERILKHNCCFVKKYYAKLDSLKKEKRKTRVAQEEIAAR